MLKTMIVLEGTFILSLACRSSCRKLTYSCGYFTHKIVILLFDPKSRSLVFGNLSFNIHYYFYGIAISTNVHTLYPSLTGKLLITLHS